MINKIKQTVLHCDGPIEIVRHDDDGNISYFWRRQDEGRGNFTIKIFKKLDKLMEFAGVTRLNRVEDGQRV